jgi:hypothetical protein
MRDTDYLVLDFDGTIADTLKCSCGLYNRIALNTIFFRPAMRILNCSNKEAQELLRTYGISKLKLLTLTLRIREGDESPHS